jgi:hypothetical protein
MSTTLLHPPSRRELFASVTGSRRLPQASRRGVTTLRLPSGAPPPDREVHLLRRTSFGFRPSDLAFARQVGWEAYLDRQLHPESIDDGLAERLVEQRAPQLLLPIRELWFERGPKTLRDFVSATLVRLVVSERQLFEVLVDFWSNHFSIFAMKDEAAVLKIVDDREVIRRHALGRFRDLLGASAKSPAMLLYLDNDDNVKTGPNENYARELMELHTLGVDGGYTQQDVMEVARALTGWTFGLNSSSTPGEFYFAPARHDQGIKVVLGEQILGDGMNEGERILDILAKHPSTARFIAHKLCRRFVADDPPSSIVDAAASTFSATDGDLRAVVRTILTSDEFFASSDAKVQRPLEYVTAVLRTLGAWPYAAGIDKLKETLTLLGQLPFHHLDPDGYADHAEDWVSSDSLLTRWNFVLDVVRGTYGGFQYDMAPLLEGLSATTPRALAHHLIDRVLARAVDPGDRDTIVAYGAAGHGPDASLSAAELDAAARRLLVFLFTSPYFQLR